MGRPGVSDVCAVRYLRLPTIVKAEAAGSVKDPFANCTLDVESPTDLPLKEVTVNDQRLALAGTVREKRGSDAELWKIAVPRVPLAEGPNRIVLTARNDDGWVLEPRKLAVQVTAPPPAKAEVAFLSPAEDLRTDRDQLTVRLHVKSASRIQELFLCRGGQEVWRADEAVLGEQGTQGFEITAAADVTLLDGVNRLEAVAVNQGGESQASVRATFVPLPVRLFVDRVESVASGRETAASLEEGSQPVFSKPADDGIAWLHGRIRWANAGARSLWPKPRLFVSVNGFLQPQVIVGSQPELEQTWRAKIRLNQSKDNKVTVLLPGISQDAANRTDFRIDCRNPNARQRLLLLVISIPNENEEALKRQALEAVQEKFDAGQGKPAAVQGTPAGKEPEPAAPVLPHAKIVATLTGASANRHALINQLFNIRFAINQSINSNDLGNEVVLIYYRGSETVDESGQFQLLTSENDTSLALSGNDLTLAFDKAPGAQVFLLDVTRTTAAAKATADGNPVAPLWPGKSRIAALRCAWLRRDQTPTDAGQLLAALRQVVPRASNLYEINAAVSQNLRGERKYGETLIYDQYIPGDLNTLVLRDR